MSVVIESGSSVQISGGTTAISCPLPAGVVAGNLLLIFAVGRSVTIATPSGYTMLVNKFQTPTRLNLWYRIATGSEANPVSSSINGGTECVFTMNRLSASAGRMFDGTCIVNPQSNHDTADTDRIVCPDQGTAATGEVRIASAGGSGNGGTISDLGWSALSIQSAGSGSNTAVLHQRWNGPGAGACTIDLGGTMTTICGMSFIVKDIPAPVASSGLFFGNNF
jgi:hypothetical protein